MSPIEKPLVFLSASSKDYDWRDRLKQKLDAFGDDLQWWDDSRVETGKQWPEEIATAIGRASVAVVLLSPDYVKSKPAKAEFSQLAKQSEGGHLKLFPIVLRPCLWKNLPLLEEVMIWSHASPILEKGENTSKSEVEHKLELIAKEIRKLATSSVTPTTTPRAEFQFNRVAQQILKRARELAERSRRTGVDSSCLLFAFSELAASNPDSAMRSEIGQLIRSLFDRAQGYDAAFQEFMTDGEWVAHQIEADGGPLLGRVSANVRKTLENGADIAAKVSGSREICERHLFGALLLSQSNFRP